MIQKQIKFNTVVLLLVGAILMLASGLLLFISSRALETGIEQSLEEATQPLVTTTARLLFNPLYTMDVTAVDEVLRRSSYAENIVYIGVRDKEGRLIADSKNDWIPDENQSLILATQAIEAQGIVQEISTEQSIIVSPITVGSEQIGTVEFIFDLVQLRTTLGASQRTITFATILIFAGAILAIAFSFSFMAIRSKLI